MAEKRRHSFFLYENNKTTMKVTVIAESEKQEKFLKSVLAELLNAKKRNLLFSVEVEAEKELKEIATKELKNLKTK